MEPKRNHWLARLALALAGAVIGGSCARCDLPPGPIHAGLTLTAPPFGNLKAGFFSNDPYIPATAPASTR